MRALGAGLASLVFVGLDLAPAQAAGTFLKLPCEPQATSSSFLTPCSEVIQKLEEDLTKYAKLHVTCIYNGIIADKELSVNADPESCAGAVGRVVAKPICTYIPGRFVRMQNGYTEPYENMTNHKGESCGQHGEIDISISGIRWTADDGFSLGGVTAAPDATGDKMKWEWSHVRGIWVHVLTWAWEQVVLMEIRPKAGFTVSEANSPIQAETQAAIEEFRRLTDQLEGIPNLQEIRKCELQNWDKEGVWVDDDTKKHDVGQLRQRASYLCAAWKNLQGAIFHLAVAEIFSRAIRSARANAYDNQQQIIDEAKAYVKDPCQSAAMGCWPSWSVESCANREANECLKQKVEEFLKQKLLSLWPLQQLSVAPLGGLGFAIFRRRRPRGGRRKGS